MVEEGGRGRRVTSWSTAGSARFGSGGRGGCEALLQQSAANLLVGAEEDEAAGADEGHSGDTAGKQTGGGENGEKVLIGKCKVIDVFFAKAWICGSVSHHALLRRFVTHCSPLWW